jgi:hypothetical protein
MVSSDFDENGLLGDNDTAETIRKSSPWLECPWCTTRENVSRCSFMEPRMERARDDASLGIALLRVTPIVALELSEDALSFMLGKAVCVPKLEAGPRVLSLPRLASFLCGWTNV